MNLKMRKGAKYTFIFFASALVIVPTSLYISYRVQHKEGVYQSNIGKNGYGNNDHSIYTIEGAYPGTFDKDNDRIPSNKQKNNSYPREYGNNQKRLDEPIDKNIDNGVYDKENIQNTTYLFKNKKDFINLFLKVNPNKYIDENSVIKEYKKLLDNIDFNKKDLILLNNYVNIFMPYNGDRGKLGGDIKEYTYDDSNKTLKLKGYENYEQKKCWWKSNSKGGCAVDKALGSNYWYRSFFIIVDKTSLNNYKDLKINMEYEWIK